MTLSSFVRNHRGETLVSIIIAVVMLSIIIGGVSMIMSSGYSLEETSDHNTSILFLKSNATNILRSVDTSAVREKEVFVIRKIPDEKRFEVLTGDANVEAYKYINADGESVTNTGTYPGTIYTQYFLMDKVDAVGKTGKNNQIIKVAIRELIRK